MLLKILPSKHDWLLVLDLLTAFSDITSVVMMNKLAYGLCESFICILQDIFGENNVSLGYTHDTLNGHKIVPIN